MTQLVVSDVIPKRSKSVIGTECPNHIKICIPSFTLITTKVKMIKGYILKYSKNVQKM